MRILLLLLLVFPAFAATNRTVTVKPSGGDYTSLSAAIAAEKGDLVSADTQLTIECYAMDDTTAVSIAAADWTTDATRYILITVPTAERHAGVWDDTKYKLTKANGIALSITESFVRVEGLQIGSTGNYATVKISGLAGSGTFHMSKSLVRGTSSAAYQGPVYIDSFSGGSVACYFWNNLFYGASGTYGRGWVNTTGGTFYVLNNTFAANTRGVANTAGTTILVNNVFTGNTETSTSGSTMGAGTDYNRTNNSAVGYVVTGSGNTHDAVDQTFSFVNAGALNWHLAADDSGAKDLGVSDPGSGLFSDDVDGETRSGSWDAGFDEMASSRRRNAVVAWRRQ